MTSVVATVRTAKIGNSPLCHAPVRCWARRPASEAVYRPVVAHRGGVSCRLSPILLYAYPSALASLRSATRAEDNSGTAALALIGLDQLPASSILASSRRLGPRCSVVAPTSCPFFFSPWLIPGHSGPKFWVIRPSPNLFTDNAIQTETQLGLFQPVRFLRDGRTRRNCCDFVALVQLSLNVTLRLAKLSSAETGLRQLFLKSLEKNVFAVQ